MFPRHPTLFPPLPPPFFLLNPLFLSVCVHLANSFIKYLHALLASYNSRGVICREIRAGEGEFFFFFLLLLHVMVLRRRAWWLSHDTSLCSPAKVQMSAWNVKWLLRAQPLAGFVCWREETKRDGGGWMEGGDKAERRGWRAEMWGRKGRVENRRIKVRETDWFLHQLQSEKISPPPPKYLLIDLSLIELYQPGVFCRCTCTLGSEIPRILTLRWLNTLIFKSFAFFF